MSRYIDADHLIERATNPYGDCWAATCEGTPDFVDYINEEPTAEVISKENLKEEFEREIEIANKDIDLMPDQEDYMRGYLGGILCAYRIVFGKNYEEKTE